MISSKPYHRTSILVSPEFYKLSKEKGIKFSEALRVGISMMLAEKGDVDYDNKLNIYKKMTYFKDELEKSLKRLEELEKVENAKQKL